MGAVGIRLLPSCVGVPPQRLKTHVVHPETAMSW